MTTEVFPESPAGGKHPLCWRGGAAWLPGCVLLGVLLGGAAAVVHTWFAPLIFFPLLVGFLLGMLSVGWLRLSQVAYRPIVAVGVILAVCATVGVEHYTCFQLARRAALRSDGKELGLARAAFPERLPSVPDSFGHYLVQAAERGRPILKDWVARAVWAWASWAVAGILIVVGAAAILVPALRMPYCDRCRSWYRTTASGRLSAGATTRLAALLGVEIPDQPAAARYRILTCESGCGPTGIELSWRVSRYERRTELVWLDQLQRLAVLQFFYENQSGGRSPQPKPSE